MNRKPPELPNIEDATLRACLAPLMEAMSGGAEVFEPAPRDPRPRPVLAATAPPGGRSVPPGSNDNPRPVLMADSDAVLEAGQDEGFVPRTRADWRAAADDDFGLLRTVQAFLARTDEELDAAAAAFPRQLAGTLTRLTRFKARLAAQTEAVTEVQVLLRRALARAEERTRDAGTATPAV